MSIFYENDSKEKEVNFVLPIVQVAVLCKVQSLSDLNSYDACNSMKEKTSRERYQNGEKAKIQITVLLGYGIDFVYINIARILKTSYRVSL